MNRNLAAHMLQAVGMLCFLGWMVAVSFCYQTNAKVPDAGRSYEIGLHGTVYVTPWLGRAYHWGMIVAVGLIGLATVIGKQRGE